MATEPRGGLQPVEEDLKLMVQWFTATIYTVTYDEMSLRNYQQGVSREAMSHGFLMSSILATSALHLSETTMEPNLRGNYAVTAFGHHNRCLASYKPEMAKVTSSNYTATVAFASLISICSFVLCRPSHPTKNFTLVDDLRQIFGLTRSWHEVLRTAPVVQKEYFDPNLTLSSTSELPEPTRNALRHLRELNMHMSRQGSHKETEVYGSAIETLTASFGSLQKKDRTPHLVSTWANSMPEMFLKLIEEHRTLALIILAHYCVILNHFNEIWWLRDWGKGLLASIWRGIDPGYRENLAWPMNELRYEITSDKSQIYSVI